MVDIVIFDVEFKILHIATYVAINALSYYATLKVTGIVICEELLKVIHIVISN